MIDKDSLYEKIYLKDISPYICLYRKQPLSNQYRYSGQVTDIVCQYCSKHVKNNITGD